jgi:EXLDI family protein
METITVRRDEEPDLVFEGVKIASVTSLSHTNDIRWTELTLYRTATNRYVVERLGCTNWQGEMTRWEAFVTREETHFPDIEGEAGAGSLDESARDEIKKFLGYGWLAKELYDAADIEARETV